MRLEEFSNVKHEYLDGQIFAMAGGTPEHAALAMAVGSSLSEQLQGRRCRVYSSDARVRVVATGLDTYPDISVVCGAEERDTDDPLALVNSVVLAEVTSPGTEEYDRGEKLSHYQRIPTLREVVFLAHDAQRIDVWRRGDDDQWHSTGAGPEETVRLDALDCTLDVAAIYRDPLAG